MQGVMDGGLPCCSSHLCMPRLGVLSQVQAEIPGSPVFIMKLAPRARHLEVQLLADEYVLMACL